MPRAFHGLLLAVLLPVTAWAQQPIPPIQFEEFTLANGLRFLVHEDHSTPVVAVNVYYDVGSANDPIGRSGFAHLFEHMLFQETENLGKGEMMALFPAAGGTFQGATAPDRTFYYETLPANRVNLAFWAEAERMGRLRLEEQNFKREVEVVKEERRMRVENQPYVEAIAITLDTLLQEWAPYDRPTPIGSMEELDAATLQDVREFHRRYYVPNNAVVAVAGDVTLDQVRELAERYFGGIARGEEPPPLPPLPEIPRKSGERRITVVDRLANTPLFASGYAIPPVRDPDVRALELLASVFSQGASSRLYQRLVKDERAALEVIAALDTRLGPGKLLIAALPNQGVPVEQMETLIQEEIDRLHREGITEQELRKAKNQMRANHIRQRLTVEEKADLLQQYRRFHGDAGKVNTIMDDYMAVTIDDVRRVAARYLTPANRTVVIVQPAERAAAQGPGAEQGGDR